ncbi:BnaA05g16510D [Brassica napus]|uniref:BnaA05g16510D protein n=1 Tax=Brassica napus TaxID=3708 RepID=A0A078HAX4_BRANA|nr:BnaA05g16510D [Brassica napus]
MGHLKLSSLLLGVLLILNILLVSADTSRTQVIFATDRASTGGNQAVALHPRTRINHGSNRGPRKHLVTPTVEQDVYTVPESSA